MSEHSLLEGEDPIPNSKQSFKKDICTRDDNAAEGEGQDPSGKVEEKGPRKPGLTRQRTLIELDQNSMEKLLNFAAESDDSEGESSDSPKKSPMKSPSFNDFETTSYSLDTVEMHSRLQEELNSTWSPSTNRHNLSLEELSHVRYVAAKAEVDNMQEEALKKSVAAGKVCFQCKKTRFNIFRRAKTCQVCRHSICSACQEKISATSKLNSPAVRESSPVDSKKGIKEELKREGSIRIGSPSNQGALLIVCQECSQTIQKVTREEETAARMVRARSALFSSFRRKNSKSELSKSCNP